MRGTPAHMLPARVSIALALCACITFARPSLAQASQPHADAPTQASPAPSPPDEPMTFEPAAGAVDPAIVAPAEATIPAEIPEAELLKPVQRDYMAAIRQGELGAFIGVTSGVGPFGFNPSFAREGGWRSWGRSMAGMLRQGKFTRVIVWRPHGDREPDTIDPANPRKNNRDYRGRGAMPADAHLYLNPRSADPVERAAADRDAFIDAMREIRQAIDQNARELGLSGGVGELLIYTGNFFQAGPGEIALKDQPNWKDRWKEVLHLYRAAKADGVIIDASGGDHPADSVEEEAMKMILEWFDKAGCETAVGVEQARKKHPNATDPRRINTSLGVWFFKRGEVYQGVGAFAPRRMVAGRYDFMLTAVLDYTQGTFGRYATTRAEHVAFIREAMGAGYGVYLALADAIEKKYTPADWLKLGVASVPRR